ncbi:MAG: NADH-quinone oxidoreductase subunit C [Bacillota bacterium]|nr:NADH-quinone oxidoreductase subunit C [Bacillota bacterium]
MEEVIASKDRIQDEARKLLDRGARLANLVCIDDGETFELIYVFQEGLDLVDVRVRVAKDEEVPSLSGLQLSAALIENEVKEFFGLNITGLAIDFQCRMLLGAKSPRTPMLKQLPVV